MARVVAYYEGDVARIARAHISQQRIVDARYRCAWNCPGGGDTPVAAVDQPGDAVRETCWLRLGQRRGNIHRGDLSRASALVETYPIDCHRIVTRCGLYLKAERPTHIDTYISGEAHDIRGIPRVDF